MTKINKFNFNVYCYDRRLLSTFTLRRDSPDCPLLFLLLMFTFCFMCSTSTELDDIGSSSEVLCLIRLSDVVWEFFFFSVSLIDLRSLSRVPPKPRRRRWQLLSLLTRLVSVIRYVSICLFFLCVYCWILCNCWRLDCHVHGQYLGEPDYHKYGRCDESCGQTHGVVWSSRRITCSQEIQDRAIET